MNVFSLINQPLFIKILIPFIVFVGYINTFTAPFEFDDITNIAYNPLVADLRHIPQLWSWQPGRFIANITFALNFVVSNSVTGFHLLNIAIHIANGFVVYYLIKHLKKDIHWFLPLSVALLFISHPIQTQAVTYIIQRTTSLAALFYLSSILLYILYIQRPKAGHWFYVLSCILAVLAFFTKEHTFTLPFILILYEWILGGKKYLRTIPFFILATFVYFVSLFITHPGLSVQNISSAMTAVPQEGITRQQYFFTQFNVIRTYIRLLVFPINQNLDYDYPITSTPADVVTLMSFNLILLLIGVAIYLRKRHPLISFGILFFFITLSIESSLIPIDDVIMEHRLYLPSVGFFLAVISSCFVLREMYKKKISINTEIVIFGIILLLLTAATLKRNSVWADEVRLWSDVVTKSPMKARPQYTLASVFLEKNNFQKAKVHFIEAIKLNPNYYEAHADLGAVYASLDEQEKAEQAYKAALAIKPHYASANNLGILYREQEKYEDAIRTFLSVLDPPLQEENSEIPMGRIYAHFNLGLTYYKNKQPELAKKEFQSTVDLAEKAGIDNPLVQDARQALRDLRD